jgi:hypothetical protein
MITVIIMVLMLKGQAKTIIITVIIKMANTIKPSILLLSATALILIFVVSVSEAAPFFIDSINGINMPSLPTVEMGNMRLPEIDPATMINNGGQAIARAGDGIVVMLDNGMQFFMRQTNGAREGVMNAGQMFLRMFRSLPLFG